MAKVGSRDNRQWKRQGGVDDEGRRRRGATDPLSEVVLLSKYVGFPVILFSRLGQKFKTILFRILPSNYSNLGESASGPVAHASRKGGSDCQVADYPPTLCH